MDEQGRLSYGDYIPNYTDSSESSGGVAFVR